MRHYAGGVDRWDVVNAGFGGSEAAPHANVWPRRRIRCAVAKSTMRRVTHRSRSVVIDVDPHGAPPLRKDYRGLRGLNGFHGFGGQLKMLRLLIEIRGNRVIHVIRGKFPLQLPFPISRRGSWADAFRERRSLLRRRRCSARTTSSTGRRTRVPPPWDALRCS
jgi:hypothetical protein